jgi:outer membrane protein TolC
LRQSSHVFDNQFTDWSLGFRYERPIGRRAEFAARDKAELAFRREQVSLRQLQDEVRYQLHAAYQEVLSQMEVLGYQKNRLAAGETQFKAQSELYRLETHLGRSC